MNRFLSASGLATTRTTTNRWGFEVAIDSDFFFSSARPDAPPLPLT